MKDKKVKRVYISSQLNDLNYNTGEPMTDLYTATLKLAVRDLIKLQPINRDWQTAKQFVDNSPIKEEIYYRLKQGGIDIEEKAKQK